MPMQISESVSGISSHICVNTKSLRGQYPWLVRITYCTGLQGFSGPHDSESDSCSPDVGRAPTGPQTLSRCGCWNFFETLV